MLRPAIPASEVLTCFDFRAKRLKTTLQSKFSPCSWSPQDIVLTLLRKFSMLYTRNLEFGKNVPSPWNSSGCRPLVFTDEVYKRIMDRLVHTENWKWLVFLFVCWNKCRAQFPEESTSNAFLVRYRYTWLIIIFMNDLANNCAFLWTEENKEGQETSNVSKHHGRSLVSSAVNMCASVQLYHENSLDTTSCWRNRRKTAGSCRELPVTLIDWRLDLQQHEKGRNGQRNCCWHSKRCNRGRWKNETGVWFQ